MADSQVKLIHNQSRSFIFVINSVFPFIYFILAIPLNDDELVYICQISDDNRTNRVLVVPISGFMLVPRQREDYSG